MAGGGRRPDPQGGFNGAQSQHRAGRGPWRRRGFQRLAALRQGGDQLTGQGLLRDAPEARPHQAALPAPGLELRARLRLADQPAVDLGAAFGLEFAIEIGAEFDIAGGGAELVHFTNLRCVTGRSPA